MSVVGYMRIEVVGAVAMLVLCAVLLTTAVAAVMALCGTAHAHTVEPVLRARGSVEVDRQGYFFAVVPIFVSSKVFWYGADRK